MLTHTQFLLFYFFGITNFQIMGVYVAKLTQHMCGENFLKVKKTRDGNLHSLNQKFIACYIRHLIFLSVRVKFQSFVKLF